MKLLEQYRHVTSAEQAADVLQSNGIPCHISGRFSRHLGGYFTGAFKVGLWVLVDEQFDEARKLLADPSYRVKNPLTKEQQHLLQHTA